MTLILVEVDTASPKAEMTFNKPMVCVGREAGECDVVFDKAAHPMVSRRHAEFRCVTGRWFVVDQNSTYGLFLNGQKVAGQAEIAVGSKIGFGTDGPSVVVIWLDAEHQAQPEPIREPQPSARPVPQVRPADVPEAGRQKARAAETPAKESWEMSPQVPPAARPATKPVPASLEFLETARPPIALAAAQTWLGRDASCDVVIEGTAAVVSRRHAQIRLQDSGYVIEDNKSFNGTLVNEQRITAVTPLYHDDTIRLGVGGPVIRFNSPLATAPKGASLPGQRALPTGQTGAFRTPPEAKPASGTMVLDRGAVEKYIPGSSPNQPQLLMSVVFGTKPKLTIGRGVDNDIKLDGLLISNHHARLTNSPAGIVVEDLRSTNGVYVNGRRITREQIGPNDSVQIGAFLISVDAAANINVFDTRSRSRLDVVNVTREIRGTRLLDSVSLSIGANEFIGVLGPSGAGKSILMETMAGLISPSSGNVLVNNQDLQRNHDSLKQSIGFVPQDDIIHRELSVYRTLYYVAKMRLSRDVSSAEVRQIVDEVLDVTGLSERRDVRVSQLSGGQRKRVSIAVELITKPSIIFLDEPTSGLDPGAEGRIMRLFRQIAESGRTVIMTTHAMENVMLFDKIAILLAGKLIFFGKPDEALAFLGAPNLKEIFAQIEQPSAEGGQGLHDQAAEKWRSKFRSTPQFEQYVQKPIAELGSLPPAARQKKRRLGLFGSIGQWFTLSRRYLEVLFRDKLTLFILLAQAPILALMTFLVVGPEQTRDFVYFVLAMVAVWFGTSVSAREIIRERPVYKRERMVNLGLLPYLASKLFVIGIIVVIQCLLLFVPLKIADFAGLMSMPGELFGIPQLWTMLLSAAVGVGVGLFVSAVVRTSEMATGLVPLILIPQLLFSGLSGVPEGISRPVSMTMPAAWSFDTMKRFSTLDTLEPEGAREHGKTRGKGLYKYIEDENESTVAKAKKDFENFKRLNSDLTDDDPPPSVSADDLDSMAIRKVPDDLSGYVTFLHPWMNEVVNQIVLMLMFGLLALATLIVLRLKD